MASFAPAGFLISSISSGRSPTAIRSNRPNAAEKRSSPAAISVERHARARARARLRRRRCRRCRGPGSASSTRADPSGVVERERRAVEAVQLDLARGDVERRPRVAAVRAAVVAEVPDVRGRVVVGRAAARGSTSSRRRAGARARAARGRRRPKTSALPCARARSPTCGSSPFTTSRASGSAATRVAPARRDGLELAVAVELVAKEVAEQKRLAAERAAQPRATQPRRPRRGRARRRGAGGASRRRPRRGSRRSCCARAARAAAGSRRPSPSSSSCRSSRRRGPSRCGSRAGEPVDRPRVELPEQLPGQRRAAAATGETRERARGARSRGLERERNRRAHDANRTARNPSVPRSSEFAHVPRRHPCGGGRPPDSPIGSDPFEHSLRHVGNARTGF